ncbi:MAG TPA: hypothetical protein VGN52_14530 [Burkholderiales bacterium]
MLAFWLAAAAHAAPLGTVTVMDGRAHVARGLGVSAPAEGSVLEEGDLLALEDGALLQVELADGTLLSFASGAQAMLPAHAGGKPGDLLLAAGWVKFNLAAPAQLAAVATPQVRLLAPKSTYVVNTGAAGTQLFLETGEVVPTFAASRPGQPAVVRGGDFVAVKADSSVTVARRPPPAFVSAMPKVYLDRLPVRLSKLRAKNVALKPEREAGFDDLQAWVRRYPQARAAILARFEPKLQDKDFLAQLQPVIKDYPEWEAAVRPEKPHAKKAKAK